MKLDFSLNWMGVVSTGWYDRNGIPFTTVKKFNSILNREVELKYYDKYYCCGRIDVYGHPEHPFNFEYSVDVMEGESWNLLGTWLDNLTLDYLPDNVEELYDKFESETGHKILWWKNDQ